MNERCGDKHMCWQSVLRSDATSWACSVATPPAVKNIATSWACSVATPPYTCMRTCRAWRRHANRIALTPYYARVPKPVYLSQYMISPEFILAFFFAPPHPAILTDLCLFRFFLFFEGFSFFDFLRRSFWGPRILFFEFWCEIEFRKSIIFCLGLSFIIIDTLWRTLASSGLRTLSFNWAQN